MKSDDTGVILFQKLYSKSNNTLISPLSLCMALSMTSNFMSGKTADEADVLLCDSGGLPALNKVYSELLDDAVSCVDVNIAVANALYLHEDLEGVDDEVLSYISSLYKADISRVNFSLSSVVDRINEWVAGVTRNKISKMLESLDESSIMVLLNAIYFNGTWQNEYKASHTRDGEFFNLDGTVTTAKFMSKIETMRFISTQDYLGIVDTYAGGKYQFVVLVPSGSMDNAVSSLSYERIISLMKGSKEQEVALRLPKFKIETQDISAVQALKDMGLVRAFTESSEWDYIGSMPDNSPKFIGQVLHKATFEVDEHGTEASAATAVTLMRGMSVGPVPAILTVNRPFFYGIVNKDGRILFLGSIVKF